MRSLATFSFLAMIFFRFSTEFCASTRTVKLPPVVVVIFRLIGGGGGGVDIGIVPKSEEPHPGAAFISRPLLLLPGDEAVDDDDDLSIFLESRDKRSHGPVSSQASRPGFERPLRTKSTRKWTRCLSKLLFSARTENFSISPKSIDPLPAPHSPNKATHKRQEKVRDRKRRTKDQREARPKSQTRASFQITLLRHAHTLTGHSRVNYRTAPQGSPTSR